MVLAPPRALPVLARVSALLAGGFGLLAAAVIAPPAALFTHIAGQPPSMSPLEAVGVIGLAASALAKRGARGGLIAAMAAFVVLLACLLARAVMVGPFSAAQLLLEARLLWSGTSPAACLCLGLLVAAGLLRSSDLSDVLAGAVLLIAGGTLLCAACDPEWLHREPAFVALTPFSATPMALLAFSALLAGAQDGAIGVVMARSPVGRAARLHLAVAAWALLAGWLVLGCVQAHQMPAASAIFLLVLLIVVPLTLVTLRQARVLAGLDAAQAESIIMLAALARDAEHERARRSAEPVAEHEASRTMAASMVATQPAADIRQLTDGMAHDFNNLLTVIKGSLQLLALRLPEGHAGWHGLERALAATDRAAVTTRQLLTFSPERAPDPQAVDLDPFLERAGRLLGHALGPGIDLTLRLDAAGVRVMTDPHQLERVIHFLAARARTLMQSGGEIILQSQLRSTGAVSGDGAVVYAAITLTDTGNLPGEAQASALALDGGADLAEVHDFADRYGGDLRVSLGSGHGTTIELLLPICASVSVQRSAMPQLAPLEPAADPTERTILVIEDEAHVREVVCAALRRIGYNVVEACDGRDGLAQLQTLHPAAALIDFVMPGLDGVEVARRVRQRHPDLPIIFMSGYADAATMRGIGHAALLRKPFDLNGLRETMSGLVH